MLLDGGHGVDGALGPDRASGRLDLLARVGVELAPFIAFFAAYDDYRGALATWRQDHAPLVIATAAPSVASAASP